MELVSIFSNIFIFTATYISHCVPPSPPPPPPPPRPESLLHDHTYLSPSHVAPITLHTSTHPPITPSQPSHLHTSTRPPMEEGKVGVSWSKLTPELLKSEPMELGESTPTPLEGVRDLRRCALCSITGDAPCIVSREEEA